MLSGLKGDKTLPSYSSPLYDLSGQRVKRACEYSEPCVAHEYNEPPEYSQPCVTNYDEPSVSREPKYYSTESGIYESLENIREDIEQRRSRYY